MRKGAIGFIEAVGLSTAITALDAACKNSEVHLVGCERVIGAGKAVTVTINIAGQVSAVKSAIEAGVEAGKRIGIILSNHVIPRPHEEVEDLIMSFNSKLEKNKNEDKKIEKSPNKVVKEKNRKSKNEKEE